LDVADLYGVETYSKIKQLSRRVKELLNIQDRVEKSIESDPIGSKLGIPQQSRDAFVMILKGGTN